MAEDLVLRSTRVVTPEGERPAVVVVADGTIAAVLPYGAPPPGARVTDLGTDALLPGLVDTHVHVNDPGRAEWEGFASATAAAVAGGVTTLVDMPLNSLPPTTTAAHLEVKRAAARGRVHTDTGFWGGAVPGNTAELEALYDAGVFGFKCFLLDSGVPEFPPLEHGQLARVMAELARLGGLLIVHAEDPALIGAAPVPRGPAYADFLASRPPAAEERAVAGLLELAAEFGTRVHVLHLSSASVLPLLADARRAGLPVTAETCPHFLTLAAEQIPDGATEFKCCPPIREAANQDALWQALADGLVDCVVSDHSPATVELKRPPGGDFGAAWGGISSLQLGLPAVWTEARRRGHGLADVARWMAEGPARLAGMDGKGAIAPGRDADLAVLDPDADFTVDPARLHHRNPVTAYAGRTLRGVVRATYLRGRLVARDGAPVARAPGEGPAGRLIRRPAGGSA
ncbi:allantoinase AllB [Actinacidiphila yeochonensis]|uniref:allantoinase AllB n=1 Tax=Actinacidiphila yeochonensis TaxID=89050 RepID=UPI00055E4669|nr:allantoinase AllB [Actinacidiphila yeochonensis]